MSEVLTSEGTPLNLWLFSHRGYEPVVFDDPWEACQWADAVDHSQSLCKEEPWTQD